MTSFYPVHLNIEGKKCLVVGGGKTAERKVGTLLHHNGKVVVVSPAATRKIENLSKAKKVLWHRRGYKVADLNRAFLVICATDSEKLNREIGREARKKGGMVNIVNVPEECDFISPAFIERGHLKVSISTGGLAPLLSKKIREELDGRFGKEYRQYTALIAKARGAILKDERLSDRAKRKKMKELLSLNIIDRLKSGEKVYCKDLLKDLGVTK